MHIKNSKTNPFTAAIREMSWLVAIVAIISGSTSAVQAQNDPYILTAQTQVAAPFGPQNGDGPEENGNLVFPVLLGASTVGYYSVQPLPTGSFDEGFGRNVKVFPSISTQASGVSSNVVFTLRDERMREFNFLSNGKAKNFDDLRRWERLGSQSGGFRIFERDGSYADYQQTTPQGIFLSSFTDTYGNTTSITYQKGSALPLRITLPGNRGAVRYENDGTHVTKVIPPVGGATSLEFVGDLLVEIQGPDGESRLKIGYDQLGYGVPTKLILGNGDETNFWYKIPRGQQGPAILYKVRGPDSSVSYLTHARDTTLFGTTSNAPVYKITFGANPVTGTVYQKELYKNNKLIRRVELEPQTGRPRSIESSNNKKVTFSYDPSGSFDTQNATSPLVTGIRFPTGETTTFRYDPSNSYRVQRVLRTRPGTGSKAIDLVWKGAQLNEKLVSVNGNPTRRSVYEYSGAQRYPLAIHETEINRLNLDSRGVPVGGLSDDGEIWSVSTTPNVLRLTVDGTATTFTTSYSPDGELTQVTERNGARLMEIVSPDRQRTTTKIQFLKNYSSGWSSSSTTSRASLFMNLAFAQSTEGWSDAGQINCGPGSGGASGSKGPGSPVGSSCSEKVSETQTPDGGATSTTETKCDGGSGAGSSSSNPGASSSSSSGGSASSSSKKSGDGEKEDKPPRVPRAGDIYSGISDDLKDALDYAGNFMAALPDALAEAAGNELEGLGDALADLPKVAADVFNTYFGSDSYESTSNLFQSVERGDTSIGDVGLDLSTMGLASVAKASWAYANGGSGEEFSKAMGAFGGMTILSAGLGEAGGLAFKGARAGVGRALGRGVSRGAGEAVEAGAEGVRGAPAAPEGEPVGAGGSKEVCSKGQGGPPRDIGEWARKAIPQIAEDLVVNSKESSNPGVTLAEVPDFIDAIKNFPEVNGPPDVIDWGIDSGRAWAKVAVGDEEGIWYRSSGKAGSHHDLKAPGEWLPIPGKRGGWFVKDVEAIAYVKQGESFTAYVNQLRAQYGVDVGHVTPRPDLGNLSKWLGDTFSGNPSLPGTP